MCGTNGSRTKMWRQGRGSKKFAEQRRRFRCHQPWPEFISNALNEWTYMRGVKLHFICPGKPVYHAYIENFSGRLRDECLNQYCFISSEHARRVIEEWHRDYN
jgi:transposase InsO family protein